MTRKSKDFLDKLIQEPAIEKVLRAELKRYKAEEELRQQEAASIAHEARLAKQVEAEAARQQRQRDELKREHLIAASRMKRRIEEAKRHIAANQDQVASKAAANMSLAERRMADLQARRAEERRRRHEADEERVKKFKDTKAAFAQAHDDRIEAMRNEQKERAEKMAQFEAERDAFWEQRKEEGQKQLEHGVQNAQETEMRRLAIIDKKARRAARLRAQAEAERQAELAARRADREARQAEAARLVREQQARDEQRRVKLAAETRAKQRKIERKKNKATSELVAKVEAKKMLASDKEMRRQLLERLVELDKDKNDRAAVREILTGVRPSMVKSQITSLAASPGARPSGVSGSGGVVDDPSNEAIRRGQANAKTAALLSGGVTPKGPTKAWGETAKSLKKKKRGVR